MNAPSPPPTQQPYRRRPPLVKGVPLLGSTVPLLSNPLLFLQQAYDRYGEVFRFQAPGKELTVLAGVNANRFVAGEGKAYFGVDGFWGEVGRYMSCPHMVTMVDGELHRYQRQMMGPLLSQQAFRQRIPRMADTVEAVLQQRIKAGPVAVGPLLRQMLSNQLSDLLLGQKASHKDVEAMIYYFNAVTKVYAMGSRPPIMLSSPKVRWARWITRRQLQQTLTRARQRMQSSTEAGLYLDTILPALDARPDWFGKGDKLAHVLLPYVAALDTVAATKGFMLQRLLQDPALLARIQAEVDAVFGQGVPDLERLRAMADLNGLYREVMRLQPAAFGIPRTALCDFNYQGYDIRAGDSVLVFTTADHRNPGYFPAPERFDIERYRSPREEHRQPAYAPFGKGPHNCLGASLSELILPLHMGLLLYWVELEPACDLDKVKMTFGPAPVLSKNFKVRMRWRRP